MSKAISKANKKPVKKVKSLSSTKTAKRKIVKKAEKTLKKKQLTWKQKIFCQNYVLDWNATRSYRKAYPNTTNDNSAAASAHNLLRNPKISAYMDLIQKDLEKLCGISKARIINEHVKLAFNSISGLHNTWIERKEFELLSEDQKACIAEISTQTRTVRINEEPVEVEFVKIKLYDKQKALDSIAKLYGYDAPVKAEIMGTILHFDSDDKDA